MVRRSRLALAAAGLALVAAGAWSLYQRSTTEQVPYTVVARLDEVELRRYPPTLTVETTAPADGEAFRRLFRYISGANDGGTEVAMTAPVAVESGSTVPMTAPVAVTGRGSSGAGDGDEVRMAFYLPASYDLETAPRPTDDSVELVAVPERTLAVRRFSGWPTGGRVDRETERLLATLETASVDVAGEPFFLGYDAPWTLPVLRRNEVAVEVESDA
jgi:hypothetical protein